MKFSRNCPKCKEEITYSRKYDRNIAEKENKICYSCKMKEKSESGSLKRKCPECDIEIIYTNKGNRNAAEKANKKCLKCTKNEKRGITKFKKECPKCTEPIYYKNQVSLNEGVENNSQCLSCQAKEAKERQTYIGNKGMMIKKYGKEEGLKRFKKSEEKRKESFKKYWEEHPDELNDLVNRRETMKSKFYKINDINCQGTSEKYYIEKLIEENKKLPKKPKGINTPHGFYFPDFEYPDYYVEIKSPYTYNVLLKPGNIQYLKIKWVATHIKPIKIISSNYYKKFIKEEEFLNKTL